MKELVEFFKREWELAILGVVVVIVVFGAFYVMMGGDEAEENVGLQKKQMIRNPSVSARSLCFLQSPDGLGLGGTGPFGLPACIAQEERKPVAPKPKPRPKPVPRASTPRPVVKPKPVAVAPEPVFKEEPKPEPLRASLYYSECQTMADGTRVGLFELNVNNNRSTVVLGQGESQHGIKVEGVSERSVLLRDARGRRIELKSGSEGRVWILSW